MWQFLALLSDFNLCTCGIHLFTVELPIVIVTWTRKAQHARIMKNFMVDSRITGEGQLAQFTSFSVTSLLVYCVVHVTGSYVSHLSRVRSAAAAIIGRSGNKLSSCAYNHQWKRSLILYRPSFGEMLPCRTRRRTADILLSCCLALLC